jgi:ABC-type sugar transport system substrate-binding protein
MNMRARKDNAGTRTVARLFRASATDYVGGDNSLSTSYALYRDIMEKNPDTNAAWTSSDITALEAGVKVTS